MGDNIAMEQMTAVLEKLGYTADEIDQIEAYYRSDRDGLTSYVLYIRAAYDDRHEYLD